MPKKFNQRIGVVVLVLGLAPGVGSEEVQAARNLEPRVMAGQVYDGGLSAKRRAELASPRRVDPAAPVAVEMRLEPFADAAILEKSEPIKGIGVPLKVGDHREMPPAYQVEMGARDLVWEPARDGGEVAVFSVTSPAAKALRLALDFERLPRGAEVRFYSPGSTRAEAGVFEAAFLASPLENGRGSDPFWSPVIHGETAIVEIWVPAWRRGSDVRVSVRRVSHIYRSLDPKDLRHLGASGSCNRDLQCFKKWTRAGDAVAKIVFEVGGGSALCTGQLMSNPEERFLFLTAAHCINSKREANSASLFWRFQRAACGGSDPSSVIQTGGGGRLLFTSASPSAGLVTDHTLMELRRDPTAVLGEVSGLGWAVGDDPEDNLRERIHSAHHPFGDLKKASRGKVQDTWQLQPSGDLAGLTPPTHYEVKWNRGTTEPGSSGGPILIGKRWPRQFVIGVLTGGLASCSARRDPDFYGMFEETFRRFPKFRRYFEE